MSLFDLPARTGSLVLASGSPRRQELLREAGFELVVAPQDVDETPRDGETPQALVRRLAELKASSACERARGACVIVAADTIVAKDGSSLGKPRDAAQAQAMLSLLSGAAHEVSTGVCLIAVAEEGARRTISFVETTSVTFFELATADIEAYVASGEPMDKAGAYGIQGAGRALVRGIEGDYFNVVGLPVARLLRELDALLP